jgi:hypothetical protein
MNSKQRSRTNSRRLVLTLVAALAGGILPASCVTRVGDAVVSGSKSFLFSLFDPTSFIENFIDSNNGDE